MKSLIVFALVLTFVMVVSAITCRTLTQVSESYRRRPPRTAMV